MSRRENLRRICDETMPVLAPLHMALPELLKKCAVEFFIQGVAFWHDEDAQDVRNALVELIDTGVISESEHSN